MLFFKKSSIFRKLKIFSPGNQKSPGNDYILKPGVILIKKIDFFCLNNKKYYTKTNNTILSIHDTLL